MRKNIQTAILIITLITSSLPLQGCAALLIGAAAGAGSVGYVQGLLEKNVDFSVKQVHKATLSALKKLELFIKDDELNRHSASVKAEFEDGKKVTIHIEALTEHSSKIKIRVGVFGDENKSQMILGTIEKQL